MTGSSSRALFVQYDLNGYPSRDCILAIKIGRMVHTFRWPLKFIEPYKRRERPKELD